jgi:hypothetical protein
LAQELKPVNRVTASSKKNMGVFFYRA